MTELSVALQEYLRKAGVEWSGDLLRDGMIVLLQGLMEAEVSQQVGAERYERSDQRQTYRNGFRETEWETRVGELPLRIPKLRSGSYYPSFLEPRRRTERALLAVIQAAYIEGVSTRKVDELVQALGLTGIDKSKVSRICQELDGAVQAFRERHLEAAYPYVWLDAIYVKVRENHRIVSKAAVIAIGVRETGEREILGLEIGGSEDEPFWTQFLRSLVARGLSGVELVISDAHAGLTAAVAKVMSGASWQRCRVHFMRNVLTHVPKGDKSMAAAAIRTIFAQPTAETAHRQLEEVAKAMQPRWSKAAEVLLAGEDEVLTYMAFPPEHWTRIYSTNPLERLNREIKRRTDVVGIFPDSAAVIRLVGSILIEANDEWQAGRRYFSQGSMRKLHEPLEAAMPALPSPIPVAPIH